MKVEFEKIKPDLGSSFRLMKWKSDNDRFFWHQHPEYEIIYVKKGTGKLHVGNFVGAYTEGEILFLGPNLPHSGLGYGVIGDHEEIIIQLQPNFLGNDFLEAPEMGTIKNLFAHAHHGILFNDTTKAILSKKIEELENLSTLDRLLELLSILKIMAYSEEKKFLNAYEKMPVENLKNEARMNKIIDFVEKNYKREITLDEIADVINLTVPSFCRYFKAVTHYSFKNFLNQYKINLAAKLLHSDIQISDVCFESGFNNVSHFNKTFKNIIGKSPREFRNEINFVN